MKQKKVLRHQTRERIEKLTWEGRDGATLSHGYSESELNGYEALFSVMYRRTGSLRGLDLALVDLPLTYAQEIHHIWGRREAYQELRRAGLTIKKVYSSTLRHKPIWY